MHKILYEIIKNILKLCTNIFVQRKNYKHDNGALLWGCINKKAVTNSVIGKLITNVAVLLETQAMGEPRRSNFPWLLVVCEAMSMV